MKDHTQGVKARATHSYGQGREVGTSPSRSLPILEKWRFAIGTTSHVPGSKLHYLIMDIDNHGPSLSKVFCVLNAGHDVKMIWEKTENGVHVYSNLKMPFREMLILSERLGADPSWIKIARARGYAYLADKHQFKIPWPVERMVISYRK